MVSEFEEAPEAAQDSIKEKFMKEVEEEMSQWIGWVGISTVVMALLTAVGAFLAGFTANELMIERTKEVLEVSHLEANCIEIEVLKSKHAILTSLGESLDNSEIEKIRKYQDELEELETEVESEESKVRITLFEHELFAIGITLLSVGITLSGVSVVARRKKIWAVGLMFGVIGTSFLGIGIYRMIL